MHEAHASSWWQVVAVLSAAMDTVNAAEAELVKSRLPEFLRQQMLCRHPWLRRCGVSMEQLRAEALGSELLP